MLSTLRESLFRRWAHLLLQALRYCLSSLPCRERVQLAAALGRMANAGKRERVPEFQFVSTLAGGMRLQRLSSSK
jgi:hypothetical protein